MNKEQILELSTDLFYRLGFKGTTMDDIANQAGISKKTLYSHFKNKKILVEKAVLRFCEITNAEMDTVFSDGKYNAIEQLIYSIYISTFSQFSNTNMAQQQLQKYYPAIYQKLQDNQLKSAGIALLGNINKGIQEGLYRPNLNADFTIRLYLSVMFEIGNALLHLSSMYDWQYLSKSYLEYHIRSIATPKGIAFLEEVIEKEKQS